jgi:hypothetical protein
MLTGNLRYHTRLIALRRRTMTAAAQLRVEALTPAEQIATSLARRGARLELMDVRPDIGNGLGIAEVVPVRKMLHAQVPAPIVSIVDELLPQGREVLRADTGHLSVGGAAAIPPVAGGAGVEQGTMAVTTSARAPMGCMPSPRSARDSAEEMTDEVCDRGGGTADGDLAQPGEQRRTGVEERSRKPQHEERGERERNAAVDA